MWWGGGVVGWWGEGKATGGAISGCRCERGYSERMRVGASTFRQRKMRFFTKDRITDSLNCLLFYC